MRRKTKHFLSFILFFSFPVSYVFSQATSAVNGIADERSTIYAFTNATIVQDAENTINNGTLLIQKNKILGVGTNVVIPKNAIVIDCAGKFIYPSFIDLYSTYGVPTPQRPAGAGFNPFQQAQLETNNKGAFSWNQALKPEVNASTLFTVSDKDADVWRNAGFGTVLTHQRDGIARGSGTLVTLANSTANFAMLKEKASAHYSFNRGTSGQSYPSSLMGMIALLRQTYLDAQWYASLPEDKPGEGKNLSLEAWNDLQQLPQIFEANDKWNDLRASRIAEEFGKKYILKGGGNEYQRIKEMAGTNTTFILPLNFPAAPKVDDPTDARNVTLSTLMHWEMAPGNPAAFEKENISFCLTADGLRDAKTFFTNLRKSIESGLSEKAALNALTKTPAQTINAFDMIGSLEAGKLANFIITNKPVFEEGSIILQNWIQGTNYDMHPESWKIVTGTFALVITDKDGKKANYTLNVKSGSSADVIANDTLTAKYSNNGSLVQISFSPVKQQRRGQGNIAAARGGAAPTGATIRLTGKSTGSVWTGTGVDTSGYGLTWVATLTNKTAEKATPAKEKKNDITSVVNYPFGAYGWTSKPEQKDVLFKNATVWTSEKEGVLRNTDVLVKNGKIAAIGKNLKSAGATEIDATGMHLTPGIIDEHSHIAVQSINEGGQSVTSEVRIGDNLNPEDINIYRQLSGGVTTSQILHGSANTIGGQAQLIKLRWGVNDTDLKFAGADPFIKFALGENVKRTTSQNNNRFPNTRMGVEEVLMDAFTRAKDYENQLKAWNNRPKGSTMLPVRRDLELDALVEILNSKRFITSHSYVQSEITAAMRVAEKFGFRYNTFTHILEGYKVADKMKKHGVNASTFSDWWVYKMEVVDAIPQNAAIMTRMGINTAINSDDAEMARRLNQEAAKSIKYGLSEEEALKMVTINPATMLHVQNKVGSIKVGKDADLVLWNNNPLSIYAVAQKTMVDGIIYFDREKDLDMRAKMHDEKNRLIQKVNSSGARGGAGMGASGGFTPPFSYLGVGDDYIDQYMQP
ncbi:MAG: amidohydrolase family protein [Chitinophagaceae bacterium]|nr:amidohydrolase family protein [Chitinophagaceae bacterium]